MKPSISVITLAVADMERSVSFYKEGLGLPAREDKPPVVYFALESTWLAIFPRPELQRYIGLEDSFSDGHSAVTLSCNVDSRQAVDEAMEQARAAGAQIVCDAKEFRWGGYAGWFADPDGHLWEVVWNPRPFM